jgi:hypothetical protein
MRLRIMMGVVLLAAMPASAQSTTGNVVTNVLSPQLATMMNVMLEPVVKGEPYTATRVITTVQKLQDGTTMSNKGQRILVRDIEGRIRQQQWMVMPKGDAPGIKMVYIKDPVTNTLIMWSEGAKVKKEAIQIKLPDTTSTAKAKDTQAAANQKSGTVEELGQQSIEGVLVTGERITHMIPAGSVGNDQPLTRTNEIWTAPDLQLVVREIYTDPRTGVRTSELQDLSRENPPITMFQPPDGYTIKTNAQAMKEMQDKVAAQQSQ